MSMFKERADKISRLHKKVLDLGAGFESTEFKGRSLRTLTGKLGDEMVWTGRQIGIVSEEVDGADDSNINLTGSTLDLTGATDELATAVDKVTTAMESAVALREELNGLTRELSNLINLENRGFIEEKDTMTAAAWSTLSAADAKGKIKVASEAVAAAEEAEKIATELANRARAMGTPTAEAAAAATQAVTRAAELAALAEDAVTIATKASTEATRARTAAVREAEQVQRSMNNTLRGAAHSAAQGRGHRSDPDAPIYRKGVSGYEGETRPYATTSQLMAAQLPLGTTLEGARSFVQTVYDKVRSLKKMGWAGAELDAVFEERKKAEAMVTLASFQYDKLKYTPVVRDGPTTIQMVYNQNAPVYNPGDEFQKEVEKAVARGVDLGQFRGRLQVVTK